jgi:hypothetical protein
MGELVRNDRQEWDCDLRREWIALGESLVGPLVVGRRR